MKLRQGSKLKSGDGDIYMYSQIGRNQFKLIGIKVGYGIGNRFGETIWDNETTLECINGYYDEEFTLTNEEVTI